MWDTPLPGRTVFETAILDLLAEHEQDDSVSPEEAARRLAGTEGPWEALLPAVHQASIALSVQGRIDVVADDGRVDPRTTWGAVRLRRGARFDA